MYMWNIQTFKSNKKRPLLSLEFCIVQKSVLFEFLFFIISYPRKLGMIPFTYSVEFSQGVYQCMQVDI